MKLRPLFTIGSQIQPILAAWVAAAVLAALVWIGLAYLEPDLRKAILYSGFGLC